MSTKEWASITLNQYWKNPALYSPCASQHQQPTSPPASPLPPNSEYSTPPNEPSKVAVPTLILHLQHGLVLHFYKVDDGDIKDEDSVTARETGFRNSEYIKRVEMELRVHEEVAIGQRSNCSSSARKVLVCYRLARELLGDFLFSGLCGS